ncbi:hypothetical protein FB561_0430 [Kribbella amoyensis]|uniref:Peptidase inhibitor family I36 n=1 Tax=Kribbella amoyensis TaxID=996641 RepID=A0A561BKS9_9ACTN|nr:hypothetical protein [Kribbella amoyensis]TWD79372.1 hypothetical protein FB561_0430 [Kribbella amoyensis]
MRKTMKIAAGMAMAGGALAASVGAGAPAAQAAETGGTSAQGGTYAGCPYGAVCVYPNGSWNGGRPSHVYYSYGAHNLSNQFGTHRVFNNQYGGAKAYICLEYGGKNCPTYLAQYHYVDKNLTPINSLKLTKS